MATAVMDKENIEKFRKYIDRVKTIEQDMKIAIDEVCNSDMVFADDYIDILLWAMQLKFLYEYLGDNNIEYDKEFEHNIDLFLHRVDAYKIKPYEDEENEYIAIVSSFKVE